MPSEYRPPRRPSDNPLANLAARGRRSHREPDVDRRPCNSGRDQAPQPSLTHASEEVHRGAGEVGEALEAEQEEERRARMPKRRGIVRVPARASVSVSRTSPRTLPPVMARSRKRAVSAIPTCGGPAARPPSRAYSPCRAPRLTARAMGPSRVPMPSPTTMRTMHTAHASVGHPRSSARTAAPANNRVIRIQPALGASVPEGKGFDARPPTPSFFESKR